MTKQASAAGPLRRGAISPTWPTLGGWPKPAPTISSIGLGVGAFGILRKDHLHFAKRLYYAKIFARRASFISLRFLPYFVVAQETGVVLLYDEAK